MTYQLYRDVLPLFDNSFSRLVDSLEWEQNYLQFDGRPMKEPRLTILMGDLPYTYSGTKRIPVEWTPEVLDLKQIVEGKICEDPHGAVTFNSCLLNYYRDGQDSIGIHKDNEPELGENPLVATLSLGGTRKFYLEIEDEVEGILLNHGDLLLMNGHCRHGIPKEMKRNTPRISLTFRTILTDSVAQG